MDIVNWRNTQVSAFFAVNTQQELLDTLARAARELGFDYCAFGMRLPLPLSNPKTLMLNNYSTDWQQRYVEANYLVSDPTVAHAVSSIQPMVWNEGLFRRNREFWDDAHAHGLRAGWAQSSYDPKGVVGMLTLSRSGEVMSQAELDSKEMKMSCLVQIAHEAMKRIHARSRVSELVLVLTSREAEVLRWTADGKTSSEVGEIMNISERTVNFHVNNALEKLGAANKTAGVIKAALLRLL